MNKIHQCQRCKDNKPCIINSRYIKKNGEESIRYMCRDCASERARNYRMTDNGKKVWSDLQKRQVEKFKVKTQCWAHLNRKLKEGKIQKPTECILCGEDKKLDAHHEDYSKPLEVTWVCRICHLQKIHGR